MARCIERVADPGLFNLAQMKARSKFFPGHVLLVHGQCQLFSIRFHGGGIRLQRESVVFDLDRGGGGGGFVERFLNRRFLVVSSCVSRFESREAGVRKQGE